MKSRKENSKSIKHDEIWMEYEEKIKKNAKSNDIKRFAKMFNKMLKEKNISNRNFANVTKISPSSISNYRSGKTMPSNEVLDILAKHLDVSVNHLLGIDECKKYSAQQVHNMLGLSEYAMEHLYSLKHNLPEVKSLDDEEPISNVFKKQLEALSLLISDKRNLIYILNSINRYIDKKQELLKEQETKDEKDIFINERIESLTKDLLHIKAEIQEYLYASLDYIATKKGK